MDAENFAHVLVHLKETYNSLSKVSTVSRVGCKVQGLPTTCTDLTAHDPLCHKVVEGVRQDQLGAPFFRLVFDGLDTNKDGTVGKEEAVEGFIKAGLIRYVMLRCCTAVLLYCCSTILLYCCAVVLLHCYTAALLYCCPTKIIHYCTVVLYCCTATLLHC